VELYTFIIYSRRRFGFSLFADSLFESSILKLDVAFPVHSQPVLLLMPERLGAGGVKLEWPVLERPNCLDWERREGARVLKLAELHLTISPIIQWWHNWGRQSDISSILGLRDFKRMGSTKYSLCLDPTCSRDSQCFSLFGRGRSWMRLSFLKFIPQGPPGVLDGVGWSPSIKNMTLSIQEALNWSRVCTVQILS